MNADAASRGVPAALAALALPPGSAETLARYLTLLERWNQKINLTGARHAEDYVRLLVQPALNTLPYLRGTTVLDIGSGNGSPGLILALLEPRLHVTLLEPRQKRWAFLREAMRQTRLAHTVVQRCRHDEYDGARADTVTVRALALPLAALAALGRAGGRIVVIGTAPQPDPCAVAVEVGQPGVHAYDIVPRGTST